MVRGTIISLIALVSLAFAAAAQTPPPERSEPPEVLETFKFLTLKDLGPKPLMATRHENYFLVFNVRTDKGNTVEVHTHWSHHIEVLSGEGTVTYGGTVEGLKEVSPGQFRGDAIVGGTTLDLHPGDYVQIPAGMPHWFKVPPGVVLHYLAVNTRE